MPSPGAGARLRAEKLFALKRGLLSPFPSEGVLDGKDKYLLGCYYSHFFNEEVKV